MAKNATKSLNRVSIFLRLISENQQFPLLILCAFYLIVSMALLIWYWVRSTEYEHIISGTLQADLENTPQEFKGLEAFILSYIEPTISQDLAGAEFDSDFPKVYGDFVSSVETALKDQKGRPTLSYELRVSQRGSQVLTDLKDDLKNTPGTLFLPIDLLHVGLSREEKALISEGKANLVIGQASGKVGRISVQDESIQNELELIREISPSIQELTRVSVFRSAQNGILNVLGTQPTQVFIITKTGINRTFMPQGESSPNRFPSTTFFPSRPYFWPTFLTGKVTALSSGGAPLAHFGDLGSANADSPAGKLGEFFFVSRPYLDVGGSGVVITLARGFDIDGITKVIVGFDIPFKGNLIATLRNMIPRLSGEIVQVQCQRQVQAQCIASGPDDKRALTDAQRELVEEWNGSWNSRNDEEEGQKADEVTLDRRSRLLSNIYKFGKPQKKGGDSEIHFSLPVRSDQNAAHLLLVTLDINHYRNDTTRIAAMAVLSALLILVILTYLWGSNLRLVREQEILIKANSELKAAHIALPASVRPNSNEAVELRGPKLRIYFAWMVLGVSAQMVVLGLVLFHKTVFGLSMTFGAALLGYEAFQLLRVWSWRPDDVGRISSVGADLPAHVPQTQPN